MAGGLRHTSAQLAELEATQSWIRAFGEALAYLIRNSPPPKDAREKQVRARCLLAIRNALRATKKIRPSLAAPEAPAPFTPPVSKSTSPQVNAQPTEAPAEAPPAPTPLRVDFTMPTGPVPNVRPGTTAGDPFTIEHVAEAD